MDDFEEAVETQTLPQFLRQDADATTSNTAPTVGEAELERLMREMSDTDLDALAGELGVGDDVGKVGLIVPQSQPEPQSQAPLDKDPSTPTISKEGASGGSGGGGGIVIGEVKGDVEGLTGGSEIIKNPDLELEKKFAEVEIGGKLPKDGPEVAGGGDAEVGLKDIASAGLSKLENVVGGGGGGDNGDKSSAAGVAGKEKLD